MKQYLIFMAILMAGFLVGCKVVDGAFRTAEGVVDAVGTGAGNLVRAVATTEEEEAILAGGAAGEAAAADVANRLGLDPADPATLAAIAMALGWGGTETVRWRRRKKVVEDEPA